MLLVSTSSLSSAIISTFFIIVFSDMNCLTASIPSACGILVYRAFMSQLTMVASGGSSRSFRIAMRWFVSLI